MLFSTIQNDTNHLLKIIIKTVLSSGSSYYSTLLFVVLKRCVENCKEKEDDELEIITMNLSE
jgi:hypothetical protein